MKKYKLLSNIALISLIFFSCSSSKKKKVDQSLVSDTEKQMSENSAVENSGVQTSNDSVRYMHGVDDQGLINYKDSINKAKVNNSTRQN